MDSTIKSLLGGIANPFKSHEGVFGSAEDAKYATRGILRTYFDDDADSDSDFLLFAGSVVRFEESPKMDVEFDHRRRMVVFVVQEPQGEDAEALKSQIRHQFALHHAALASDARARTAISIFRSLEPAARTALIESERKRERHHAAQK